MTWTKTKSQLRLRPRCRGGGRLGVHVRLSLSCGQGCHPGPSPPPCRQGASHRAGALTMGGGTKLPFPFRSPMNHGSPEWARVLGGRGGLSGVWPPLSTTAPHAGPGHWGRAASAPARLAQLSNPGPSQPLPQHSSREPDDPAAASEHLGESESAHTERRAADAGGQ